MILGIHGLIYFVTLFFIVKESTCENQSQLWPNKQQDVQWRQWQQLWVRASLC